MYFTIDDLLSAHDLEQILNSLDQAPFVDGALTAGWHAKLVKRNMQLGRGSDLAESISTQVQTALGKHPLFQAIAYPKAIHSILVSRYGVGMFYGSHVDNSYMGLGIKQRADLSFTLFLTEPHTYEGGELCLELSDGDRDYKLPAGSALVYPSSTLHQVKPVTAGTRLVVLGWVESFIRDPAKRELLFDLDTAKRSLFQKSGKTIEFDLIAKSHSNLLRQWSE